VDLCPLSGDCWRHSSGDYKEKFIYIENIKLLDKTFNTAFKITAMEYLSFIFLMSSSGFKSWPRNSISYPRLSVTFFSPF
jgi:hypothetical protein